MENGLENWLVEVFVKDIGRKEDDMILETKDVLLVIFTFSMTAINVHVVEPSLGKNEKPKNL